jgi:hypothetical protein
MAQQETTDLRIHGVDERYSTRGEYKEHGERGGTRGIAYRREVDPRSTSARAAPAASRRRDRFSRRRGDDMSKTNDRREEEGSWLNQRRGGGIGDGADRPGG